MKTPSIRLTSYPVTFGGSLSVVRELNTVWVTTGEPTERGSVVAHDLQTLQPTRSHFASLQLASSPVCTRSKNGFELWVVGSDHENRDSLWSVDLATGRERAMRPDCQVGVVELISSPRGDVLALRWATRVEVLDPESGALLASCDGAETEDAFGLSPARFHPSEPLIYVGGIGFGHEVLEFDYRTKRVLRKFKSPEDEASRIEISASGRYLMIFGGGGRGVHVWDLTKATRVGEAYFNDKLSTRLPWKFLQDSVAVRAQVTTEVVELETGKALGPEVQLPSSRLLSDDATPDGSIWVLGYEDCLVRLDIANG